jgi:hypothetical protein
VNLQAIGFRVCLELLYFFLRQVVGHLMNGDHPGNKQRRNREQNESYEGSSGEIARNKGEASAD